jgi:hypothetical protein
MNFSAKTNEANIVKIVFEILQSKFTDVCFEFTKTGIFLSTMDKKSPPTTLGVLKWNFNRFEHYKCSETQLVCINLQHAYKMIKSIKKNDMLEIFLDKNHPDDVGICVTSKSLAPPINSWVHRQEIQKLDIDIPTGYGHPIIIPTSNYQKVCKDMTSISKIIKIFSKGSYICFSCIEEGMFNREIPFGELDMNSEEEEYEDFFNTKSLSQLIKISGLCTKMQIYTKTGLPLKISVDTGTLGSIDFYIKSRDQLLIN